MYLNFGEIERLVSAIEAGFDVAQYHVDLIERWQVLEFAARTTTALGLAVLVPALPRIMPQCRIFRGKICDDPSRWIGDQHALLIEINLGLAEDG